jgi:hypothetical protein
VPDGVPTLLRAASLRQEAISAQYYVNLPVSEGLE